MGQESRTRLTTVFLLVAVFGTGILVGFAVGGALLLCLFEIFRGEEIAHLERLAGGAGAARIEIGVFEYNERALSFFDQLGYVAFERRAERAYWDGRLWSEIRLLKTL